MSDKELSKWKKDQIYNYRQLKKQSNDGEVLYVLSFDWVSKWVNFISFEGSQNPGPINN